MTTIVAVGALGGSGTRAIAQILIDSGIYMGDDLNKPNDNLIFTRLFKNPLWYKKASEREINERLGTFKQYMENDILNIRSSRILEIAAKTNPTFQHNQELKINITQKRINKPISRKIWGWKEPNTQILLEHILNYFPNIKYIHIVRHGLDMAFSDNKQQLTNWGWLYDIHFTGQESEEETAYKQMEYWVQSTKAVIKKRKKMVGNFLLVNHSQCYNYPKEEVERIIDFLQLEVEEKKFNELCLIPQKPKTEGRYKKYNLQIFDKAQLDYLDELGFEL